MSNGFGYKKTTTRLLASRRKNREVRALVYRAIRQFFEERDFLEVETPLLLRAPPPEVNIDAIPAGNGWLRTSPELHMKRLLAAGDERIFQMGRCWRDGEQGRFHHPEFIMLEWYRANATYAEILADTKLLLEHVAHAIWGAVDGCWQGKPISFAQDLWERRTVSQAFIEWAGWDPAAAYDADRFDLDLVTRVEPGLPTDHPVVLMDYPVPLGALARRKPGAEHLAERWELYLGGVELANAYTELTDPVEQRARFEDWNQQRARRGAETYPMDESFIDALKDMPPSGGIALGVDRLITLLADAEALDEVIDFP